MSSTTVPNNDCARARIAHQRGFTLVEAVLALVITAVLASTATATYRTYRERTQQAQAVSDLNALQAAINHHALDNHALPASLDDLGPAYASMRDPWGQKYHYTRHGGGSDRGTFREDSNGVVVNTDFDLYSTGPDRDSRPRLAADPSRDDVVRAANGRFVGIASTYEPRS